MKRQRTTLVVSFGSSHFTAARFSASSKNELVLEEYVSRDLNYDYTQQRDWLPAIESAAREVLSSKSLQGEAHIIAPGYSLLVKKIKVPIVEKSRQAAAITSEAEQNLPYKLEDLVWDWEITGSDDFDLDVTLLSCKKDFAEALCQSANRMGLKPLSIRSDSLMEYQAYRQQFPNSSGNVLLLKLGARSSSFVYIKPDGFLFRGIPLGGNSLTMSIAEKLGISFFNAEKAKLKCANSNPEAQTEETSLKIVRHESQQFMNRVSTEISRSTANFRSQSEVVDPQKILLSGRGAMLPGCREHLEENFSLPVEFFNPLEDTQLGEKVDAENVNQDRLRIADMIGQASVTLSISAPATDLNLLPPNILKQRALERRSPYLVAAACLLIVALFLPLERFQEASNTYQAQIEALNREWAPMNSNHLNISETIGQIEKLRSKIYERESLLRSRGAWVAFLSDIQGRLVEVEDVWLDELKILKNENTESENEIRFRLTGRMLDRENPLARVSTNVQQRVNQLLGAFSESKFVNRVEQRTFDASGQGLLKFEFTVVINPGTLL